MSRFALVLLVVTTSILTGTLTAQEVVRADDDGPLPLERVTALTQSFQKSLDDSTNLIRQNPKSLKAYSQRGDAHFFLGQMKEAVADYDKMIELDDSEHFALAAGNRTFLRRSLGRRGGSV